MIASTEDSFSVHSKVLTLDQEYRSMLGPSETRRIALQDEGGDPQLGQPIWITGYEALVVDAKSMLPMSQEFVCHSNFDLDETSRSLAPGALRFGTERLFTISQGQTTIDFPRGYGIPVHPSSVFNLTNQALHLNFEDNEIDVRISVKVEHVTHENLDVPLKALYPVTAYGLVALSEEDRYYDVPSPDPQEHGPGCMVGDAAHSFTYKGVDGGEFAGHWIVKPGRHTYRTNVTRIMNLKFDTTVHYISVHLHPFAESIELQDLTVGKSVFRSEAKNRLNAIGLSSVDSYSSETGMPLSMDHEYELVVVYDNTSEEDQDSMAVMFMYVLDVEYEQTRGQMGLIPGRASPSLLDSGR